MASASSGAASPGRAQIHGHRREKPYTQTCLFPCAIRGGKETPSGAMAARHSRRGRRKERVQGSGKIDGLVAIKKKISRWRLSY